MKRQFQKIWQEVNKNQIAELICQINGEEYHRIFRPKQRLILLGAGHVAIPVCHLANMLGFSVIVADDRPSYANSTRFPEASQIICDDFTNALYDLSINENDFVVIVTRGHRYDATCIRTILGRKMPYYIGMMGSRKRVTALLDMLEQEGFPRNLLQKVHTPIGLPIGAMTVEEIAVSIMAEIIQVRRQEARILSKEHILTEELYDEKVLNELVEKDIPKCLLMVYKTEGSTPVKSGAFMTIDKDMIVNGTIGGGCVEAALVKKAYKMIGSGLAECVTYDMNNDIASEMGMVCGGTMYVYIIDL